MAVTNYTTLNGVIVHEDRGGTQRNYVPDTLGSTAKMTDATVVTDTFEYWPYGEQRSHTGSSTTSFTYVGTLGYCQVGSGSAMAYVRARMYMSSRGRWATVDPLWPHELQYAYASGHPTTFTDRSGFQVTAHCCDWGPCPPHIRGWFEKLCGKIRRLDQRLIDAINDCIARNDGPGLSCPGITPSRLACLTDACRHLGSRVRCGTTDMEHAAGECWWNGVIVIHLGTKGSNQFDYLFDEIPSPDGDLRDYGLVLLHELGHACGIEHGDRKDDWQCNDVFSWCLYRFLWNAL